MRAKKVDGNQKEIVEMLRKIPGVTVAHTHMIGEGMPDIVVGRNKRNYWIEIKDPSKPPSKRKLTPDEQKWHAEWKGHVAVAETFEQVLNIINS